MSDEETDDESTGFKIRKLGWRSNLLNRLLSRLDKRYDESRKKSTVRTKPREKRTLGELSIRGKPFGAPKWTFQDQSFPTESPVTVQTGSPSVQQSSPTESPVPVHLSSPSITPSGFPPGRIIEPMRPRELCCQTTPSGNQNLSLDPTQLFNSDSDRDVSDGDVSDGDVSDDELETLIRAATMRL